MTSKSIRRGIEAIFGKVRLPVLRLNGVGLHVESLEDRIAPVVGHSVIDDAPVIERNNAPYTGVVRLLDGDGSATASLLTTRRHLLTAAHLFGPDFDFSAAKFELTRDSKAVNVEIPLGENGGGHTYRVQHPGWIADPNVFHGNDVAIARLTDPFDRAQNRFLVAPFGAVDYGLYTGRAEVGQAVEFAGHGFPGKSPAGGKLTGELGYNDAVVFPAKRKGENRLELTADRLRNEVQSIVIRGEPDAGFFKLTHSGAITAALPHNATAQNIQDALRAATVPGTAQTPLAGNVFVRGGSGIVDGTDRYFFVEFGEGMSNFSYGNIALSNMSPTELHTLKKAGDAVANPAISERIDGASIWGSKTLVYDFDSGDEQRDTIGLFYGLSDRGLDTREAISSPGDSGGPVWLSGNKQIAAIVSARKVPGKNPDVDELHNSTFGELGLFTRVSSFTEDDTDNGRDNFLNETLADERYHIVLAMAYQVIGLREDENGVIEEIKAITAKMVGTKLQLSVDINGNGVNDLQYEGVYFEEEASKIITLTIRGSEDHETFIIDGPLSLGGTDGKGTGAKIVLDGWEGNDKFVIGNPNSGRFDGPYTEVHVDGGDGNDELAIYDRFSISNNFYYVRDNSVIREGDPDFKFRVNYTSVVRVELQTGSGNDKITVEATNSAVSSHYHINSGIGNDTVAIGSFTQGLANHKARVFVTLSDGQDDQLIVEDSASTGGPSYLVGAYGATWDNLIKRSDKPDIVQVGAEKVVLITGSGVDTIRVEATSAQTVNGNHIYSNGGGDDVFVGVSAGTGPTTGLDTIKSFVQVDAGEGNNWLKIDDAGSVENHNYVLHDGKLVRDGVNLVRWSNVTVNVADVILSRKVGVNTFGVFAWLPGRNLNVIGGPAQDLVVVSGDDATLDNVHGTISLLGDSNSDTLTVIDTGHLTSDVYLVDKRSMAVARLADLTLTSDGFESFTLNAGVDDDEIDIYLTEALNGMGFVLNGHDGRDLIVVKHGFVSTAEVTLVNFEDLTVEADGFSLAGLTASQTFTVPIDYVQTNDGRLYLELGGPVSGSDKLVVGGTVTLDGTLTLGTLSGFTGDYFVLIDNQGSSSVTGVFDGLPQGAYVTLGGRLFQISYVGGTGNDVVLTFVPWASIGDRVWHDANRDGLQNQGEVGVANLLVKLRAPNGTLIATTQTGSTGLYQFNDVIPGSYYVEFQPPTGWAFTLKGVGSDDTIDSDVNSSGQTDSFTLTAGETRTNLDAGVISASITGITWHDQNGDGIKDNPPIAIANVQVTLLDANDDEIASFDSAPGYEFSGLPAGTYRIAFEILGSPYEFTLKDVGSDDAIDSDADRTTGWTDQFTITAGEVKIDVDGGYRFTQGPPPPPPGGGGGPMGMTAGGGGDEPEHELEWYTWDDEGAKVPLHGYYVEYADDEYVPILVSDSAAAAGEELGTWDLADWLNVVDDIDGWLVSMHGEYMELLALAAVSEEEESE